MKWRSSDWAGHKEKEEGEKPQLFSSRRHQSPVNSAGARLLKKRVCVHTGLHVFTAMQGPPSLGCILSEAQLQHLLPMLKSNLLHVGSHLQSPPGGTAWADGLFFEKGL